MAMPKTAGYLAKDHPELDVTGLSAGSGGWLGRRGFMFADAVYPGAFPARRELTRKRLDDLLGAGRVKLAALPTPLEHKEHLESGPLDADRVHGILVGLAIGDALGNTSESMKPATRMARHGEIRDYLPNRYAQNRSVGLPSDDTQLAVWTLETLLNHGEPDAEALAMSFRQGQIFGIGKTMRDYFHALDVRRPNGDVWEARQHSAGNGALMRMPGAFLPHAWTLDDGVLDTVALSSALTHDHASSTAACVAFAEILRVILWSAKPIRPEFFWETYVTVARELEGNVQLVSKSQGESFAGPIWQFVEQSVPAALKAGKSVREACDTWYSGAFLLETVPSALYILARHGDDPEEAIVRAVMDTWDNDTVAAIVGAVVGAIHGVNAFPKRWRDGLLGRTSVDDDGRVERAYAHLRQFGGFYSG